MALNAMAELARRVLPNCLFSPLRRAATAVLTPMAFSWQSGHFRSALAARALDRGGEPLPWYTYPMISFLQTKRFAGRTVLEFGAGQSTLWWARRADRVVALEDHSDWHSRLSGRVDQNVELHLVGSRLEEAEGLFSGQRFDVIVIDGLDRLACADRALDLLAARGAVIFDNSDGHWGGCEGEYPVLDLFREAGYSRIDFYGHAPGVIVPHCTSLLFRGDCFLLDGQENTVRPAAIREQAASAASDRQPALATA